MERNLPGTVKPWDPLVRLFHWSLAGFFGLAYLLEGTEPVLHSHAGYTVALLVLFRLLWGFVGPVHARWRDFWPTPRLLWTYLRQLARRTAPSYVGHDPAGAAMIVALLLCLTATAFTGAVLFAMEGSGPFAGTAFGAAVSSWHGGTVEKWHGWLADSTLVLVIIHVIGVLYTSRLHKQNLIVSMITGKKTSGDQSTGEQTS